MHDLNGVKTETAVKGWEGAEDKKTKQEGSGQACESPCVIRPSKIIGINFITSNIQLFFCLTAPFTSYPYPGLPGA